MKLIERLWALNLVDGKLIVIMTIFLLHAGFAGLVFKIMFSGLMLGQKGMYYLKKRLINLCIIYIIMSFI